METEYTAEGMKLADLVMKNTISAQHTLFMAEQLSHNSLWSGDLKRYGKLFISKLMHTEEFFDVLDEDNSDVSKLFNDFQDFMKEVSLVSFEDLKKKTNILRACRLDQDRMLKVAKGIMIKELKNK